MKISALRSSSVMANVLVRGHVSPGFEAVREQFEAHFVADKEWNAQCCVYVGSERVVDLYGTAVGDERYDADSLQTVFSSGKNLEALAVASLVDRGRLAYDDPVGKHWPEFGQNGKQDVRVEDVLRHEAGLPFFQKTIMQKEMLTENIKQNHVGRIIEVQKQVFPPSWLGSRRDYHAMTRGFVVNEIFRRADDQGRTIGEFIRDDVATALGVGDNEWGVFVGLPEEQKRRMWKLEGRGYTETFMSMMCPEFLGRRAELSAAEGWTLWQEFKMDRSDRRSPPAVEGITRKTMMAAFNSDGIQQGEFTSASTSCSARGMALIGTVMANGGVAANGVRLLSEQTVAKMHAAPIVAKDYLLGKMKTNFTQGGLNLYHDEENTYFGHQLNNHRVGYYGWHGLGGSCFQWHPDLRISFAYAPNLLVWEDPVNKKSARLQGVVLDCAKKRLQTQ